MASPRMTGHEMLKTITFWSNHHAFSMNIYLLACIFVQIANHVHRLGLRNRSCVKDDSNGYTDLRRDSICCMSVQSPSVVVL